MNYMLCRHRVTDYEQWRKVFDSDTDAQREAGLHVLHVFRDVSDPNVVVFLLRVDDIERARAFTETPDASKAGEEAGVIGEVEMSFLVD